jgi:polyphosphate kinase
VYGLAGLKTHCKACLVVRQEKDGLRRYAHLGTGNYNPKTARIYTDFSLLTCDEEITADVGLLFNVLTGNLASPKFKHLLIAPFDLARRIVELIKAETANAKAGKPATIFAKVNSLVDPEVINALYEASQAGVRIELVVRGICCLKPGIAGKSDHIRVRSFLGRFLEHSRLFRFENAEAQPILLMGSADWMPRNFQRRIECVFPLRGAHVRRRIEEEILAVYRDRQGDAKALTSDGEYVNCEPMGRLAPGAQDTFLQLAAKAAQARLSEQTEK